MLAGVDESSYYYHYSPAGTLHHWHPLSSRLHPFCLRHRQAFLLFLQCRSFVVPSSICLHTFTLLLISNIPILVHILPAPIPPTPVRWVAAAQPLVNSTMSLVVGMLGLRWPTYIREKLDKIVIFTGTYSTISIIKLII